MVSRTTMICCSFPRCLNQEDKASKSHGISFHRFPSNADTREKWLKVIEKENWQPPKRASICSEHFSLQDFNEGKLMANAVPVVHSLKGTSTQMIRTQPTESGGPPSSWDLSEERQFLANIHGQQLMALNEEILSFNHGLVD